MIASSLLFYSIIYICSSTSVIYPGSVCVIGDVQADYDQQRDPRTLMGTYRRITASGVEFDEEVVDTSAPIYEHSYFGNDTGEVAQDQYLFKVKDIGETGGWAFSETFPVLGSSISVFLTCFQDSLFDCIYNKWFWGWAKYEHPIPTLKILGGDCREEMCLKNLTIQLKSDGDINKLDPDPGDYSKLDGEFYRTFDNVTGRDQWINKFDSSLRWYYRVNEDDNKGAGPITYTYNWVYSENTGDRIACAPGYVEMPLFCTTFVYAGADPVTGQSYNPSLPRDKLGIPDYAAGLGDVVTKWKLGRCRATVAPTLEPTLEPTMYPTVEPTNKPTGTPRCQKDYIFEPSEEEHEVIKSCPFGWRGTSITRYCHLGGEWETTSDDCFLISFTDDFTYFRDELWQTLTGYEGIIAPNMFDTTSEITYLQTFPTFSGPLRIDFNIDINTSYCGGFLIQLVDDVYNTTDGDLRAFWDCTDMNLVFEDETDSAPTTPSSSNIEGYILYRKDPRVPFENYGNPMVYFNAFDNVNIQTTVENGTYLDAQQLYFGLYDNETSLQYMTLKKLSYTSFIDWFIGEEYMWDYSKLSNHEFSNYTSNDFTFVDPFTERSFIQFNDDAGILEANSNNFEFIAPFTIRFIYGLKSFNDKWNDTSTSTFRIDLTTSSSKSNIFVPDDTNYGTHTLTFKFLEDELWINDESGIYDAENKTYCPSDELYVEIYVSSSNVSVTVFNPNMSVCDELRLINLDDLKSSSLNFNKLTIRPETDSYILLSYFDVTTGIQPNIETLAPTSSPTMSPTITCPYDGFNITFNDTVIDECEFGYYGTGDIGRCIASSNVSGGMISEWETGCFKISFVDEFFDFDSDRWHVYSTQGVSGDALLAIDGSDSFRFIPEDESLVGVIRSRDYITWPMRIRAVVEKRKLECNLWAVGLGPSWNTRSPFSTRMNWGCLGGDTNKQMSLYNHTFRLYDSKCWNDIEDDTMEVIFSVRDAGSAQGAIVTTSTSDCASLKLQVHDILSQTPWKDAYLWFGSYGEIEDTDLKGKINKTIIGRFHSVKYTQVYTDFDKLMPHLWDTNRSTINELEDGNGRNILMKPNDILTSNAEIFQFKIPFEIKLGIKKPEAPESSEWKKGEYSHFVSIGGYKYSEEKQPGIIQIVWDGQTGVRLIYSGDAIYETGLDKKTEDGEDYCNWKTQDTVQDVTIYVDNHKITVIDELCNNFNMTGTHDLNASLDKITIVTLGFARSNKYKESRDRIAFENFETYQLPTQYLGTIADMNGVSSIVVDIDDIYPSIVSNDNILGMPVWAFILVVCGIVLCCCIAYCAVAWKQRFFPFKEDSGVGVNGSIKKQKIGNQSTDVSNNVQRMNSDSEALHTNDNSNNNMNNSSNKLQQKLIPDTSVDNDPNGNGYPNSMNNAQFNGFSDPQSMPQQGSMPMNMNMNMNMQQQMQMQQQQYKQMDPQSLQYQMYQQQLFYQQQFMQMMMTNPQQQAILMNMNPMQRKQYIQNQMMIYMSRIAQMQQQNMIPIQQMQNQYMQSNPGGSGEGGGTEGTGMMTGAEGGGMGMSTNAMVNLSYDQMGNQQGNMYGQQQQQMGQQQMGMQMGNQMQMGGMGMGGYNPPPQQQVEMQPIKQNSVNIQIEFFNRVPVETFYQMCPIGNDGLARTDANRARLMIAKFRGISPTNVSENDEAIAYFEGLTIDELKLQLSDLPEPIYDLLKGPNWDNTNANANQYEAGGDIDGYADFLVEFCEKVNLKQIFGQLEQQMNMSEPGLDIHHSRIVIANLRDATFGQVSENDPGVKLIINKTLIEMRFYLSNLPMKDLRLLDLKAYHRYAKSGNYKKGNPNSPPPVPPPANNINNNNNNMSANANKVGIVFPTINLNYNGDIRQFQPPKFGCFDEIMGFIMQSWPHLQTFKLMYQDDQGSGWIRITTNIDVQECIKYAVEQKSNYLSINIVV